MAKMPGADDSRVTMEKLATLIPDEASAYKYLESLRWGDTPVCPHCHATRVYFLNPANGVSRKTRTGAASQRRVWKCGECRKQFSALTGTIFHGTKVSLQTWLMVVFEMCCNKNGIAAREIERRYGVAPKTAWFMTQRIREAMKQEPLAGMLGGDGGVVVADETFIGGQMKRMNKKRRAAVEEPVKRTPGLHNAGATFNKTPVLALIDTRTGEVRSRVMPDVTGATLRKAIAEHVDMAGTTLVTDEAKAYKTFSHEFAAHHSVNHSAGKYAKRVGGTKYTSNAAENFFSQLKRSLDGTHHHVSRKHLGRYLAEFDYRYSTRTETDTERFHDLMSKAGSVRLTYRPLTER